MLLPGGVMVAPENLDLVVKVRILAGQLMAPCGATSSPQASIEIG